jgi:hypothetical protein
MPPPNPLTSFMIGKVESQNCTPEHLQGENRRFSLAKLT